MSRLLVAEDSVAELRLLVQILRQAGYVIAVATDGEQAYAKAISWKPDLILMDVHMPRMSGLAVTRLLKQTAEGSNIPIIIISSAITAEDRIAGLRAGACDYVSKPFSEQELLERVRIHLDLSKSRREREILEQEPERDIAEHPALFRAAVRLINENLDAPPSAYELAVLLSSSERRISKAFSDFADMSVSAYSRQAAMKRAHALVTQTGLSMESIAYELGYSSAANFSTAFKEAFGQPPSAIRKKHQR